MSSPTARTPETVTPTEADSRWARESSRRLAPLLKSRRRDLRPRVEQGAQRGETIAMPMPALRLLANLLAEMAKGNTVTLLPMHSELTTQQAADLLKVSRRSLIGLLGWIRW